MFRFIIISIVFIMSCSSERNEIDIQGHRGWRGLYPENSLAAFEAAIDLGVNTLELDVVISRDNQVIISHEPWINKEICDVSEELDDEKALNIFQMTYDEIKAYDCGSKYVTRFPDQKKMKGAKPRLDDLLDLLKKKDPQKEIQLNIETKTTEATDELFHPKPKDFVELLIQKLEDYEMLDISCIQSFDFRTLQEVKKRHKDQEIALLIDEGENYKNKIEILGFDPDILSPYFKLVNDDMIQTLKEKNIRLKPWTVNEIEDMQAMIEIGVDGIITDYPKRLMDILARRQQSN